METEQIIEGNRSSDGTTEGSTEDEYSSFGQELELKNWGRQRFQSGPLDEERGTCRVWIQVQEDGLNHHLILRFGGDLGTPKSESDSKKMKLKSSIFLTITSQMAGSFLALSKPGPGSGSVQAVLTACVLTNACGFLAFLSGLWLKSRTPVAARRLEVAGSVFTLAGFIGMTALIFF